MNKLEPVKALWERIKKPGQHIDTLAALLEDYKTVLTDVMASGDDYRSGLRRLQEEIPDLQRLVGKKHDAVLKGRLQDAIGMLKKKVEAVEAPAAEETTPQPQAIGTDVTELSVQEEHQPKPYRNMPSLGMD